MVSCYIPSIENGSAYPEATLLKKSLFSTKSMELLLNSEGQLVARVISCGAILYIQNDQIMGIPERIKQNPKMLRAFLDKSHIVINPTQISGKDSFTIRISLSLLGGGTTYSSAMASYDEAKSQEDGSFHTQAIRQYKRAIEIITTAINSGYTGEKSLKLSERLRDSYFGLAIAEKAVNNHNEAILHFREALHLGHSDAKNQLIIFHLSLADTAKRDNDVSTQIAHLRFARDLDSKDASTQLLIIERPLVIESIDPSVLIKTTTQTLWGSGFQLGKGIHSNATAASCVVESVQCKPGSVANHDNFFTYFISERSDLEKVINLGSELSIKQNVWHLQCIADYAKRITMNVNSVHCIIGNSYIAVESEEFDTGKLSEPALRYLQIKGFEKFRAMYGSHFIGGRSRGALFLGCISFSVANREEANHLRLELAGSFSELLKSSITAKREIKKIFEQRTTNINIQTLGIVTPIQRAVHTPDELRVHFEAFRAAIAIPEGLGPVQAICEPWTSLSEVQECINQEADITSLSGMLTYSKSNIFRNSHSQLLSKLFTPLKCVKEKREINIESCGIDLEERFNSFLTSYKKVFVLLGRAGSGKSAFLQYIERKLWNVVEPSTEWSHLIPFRIDLATLSDPITSAIPEYFKRLGFTESQIQELKQNGQVLLLLDGYDEWKAGAHCINQNLFVTNSLHEWRGKVVIAGRMDAEGFPQLNPDIPDHFNYFSPIENECLQTNLVEEALICPFILSQVQTYVSNFVHHANPELRELYPDWFINDGALFRETLTQDPGLSELVKTPFLLSTIISVLPKMMDSCSSGVAPVREIDIYRHFVTSCIERELAKKQKSLNLEGSVIPPAFREMSVVEVAIQFCSQIAKQMSQENKSSIVYIPNPGSFWDLYFGDHEESAFLRTIISDILRRSSVFQDHQWYDQYEFVHSNLKDYFVVLS